MMKVWMLPLCLWALSALSTAGSAYAGDETRVISIDGSITEIVYALGAADHLVGVDTTSRYPAAAQALPNVGYMRQLTAEGILSLQPSLVITTAEAGPVAVLEQLDQAGLRVETVTTDSSIAGVYAKIRRVAQLLAMQERGEELIGTLQSNIQTLQAQLYDRRWQAPPKVMFLLAAGNHGVMLAGKNTHADAMIQVMGGVNVVSDFNSYKPLTPEGGLQTLPDIIVVADTGSGGQAPASERVLERFQLLQHTPAARQKRVITADSMLLLGFGPRIDQAIEAMAPAFYVSR
ncbi:MAG: ABC transporter substrate-binding protein [Pseudomonadota bacterium]|nr:ABC transporter substrate-binding protein [Pseudomonadota bacterium]